MFSSPVFSFLRFLEIELIERQVVPNADFIVVAIDEAVDAPFWPHQRIGVELTCH
jgi:hypothetical protein